MNMQLYELIPFFSLGLFALAFRYKIYKRSVSTFLTIIMVALSSNLVYYGYINSAIVFTLMIVTILLYRAIIKPTDDTFLIKEKHVI